MFPKGWFKEVTGLPQGVCGWLVGGGPNIKRSSITQLDLTHVVSQRVIVMSSDSFVSIVLPMSILLCSITSARIADIVDTCLFVKYLADMGPFLLHWLMLKRLIFKKCRAEHCQDDELVCNAISYKDIPEKMLIGTFGPFQETCYPTKFIWEITVEYFNNSCIYFKYHSENIFWALYYNLIEIHRFNINTSSFVSTVNHSILGSGIARQGRCRFGGDFPRATKKTLQDPWPCLGHPDLLVGQRQLAAFTRQGWLPYP